MHTWPVEIRRGIVRQDHAEVEIAVCAAIAAGGGTEQIDTLRLKVIHQTTRNLRDGLVLGHPPLLCTETRRRVRSLLPDSKASRLNEWASGTRSSRRRWIPGAGENASDPI